MIVRGLSFFGEEATEFADTNFESLPLDAASTVLPRTRYVRFLELAR